MGSMCRPPGGTAGPEVPPSELAPEGGPLVPGPMRRLMPRSSHLLTVPSTLALALCVMLMWKACTAARRQRI